MLRISCDNSNRVPLDEIKPPMSLHLKFKACIAHIVALSDDVGLLRCVIASKGTDLFVQESTRNLGGIRWTNG
ncbi:MAG TPA: hypothetical protein VLM41_08040 [Steroidobacteraceae bacterium]|nr:hypothetical protein [Steroidobacteraceae bacterium]